jgi:hypothetical protein
MTILRRVVWPARTTNRTGRASAVRRRYLPGSSASLNQPLDPDRAVATTDPFAAITQTVLPGQGRGVCALEGLTVTGPPSMSRRPTTPDKPPTSTAGGGVATEEVPPVVCTGGPVAWRPQAATLARTRNAMTAKTARLPL